MFLVVYFIRKQKVENKERVMVGLLIDSLRNLNPPFRQRRHMAGTPSGEQGDYLKVPGRHIPGLLMVVFCPILNFF